ncbi:MAG TPA: hypothetical protein VD794_12950 [Flavisolibacter sp.]|nr:hypothetical protein [Flavisolibacter sp.]
MIIEITLDELTQAYALFIYRANRCRFWQFKRKWHYEGMAAAIAGLAKVHYGVDLVHYGVDL